MAQLGHSASAKQIRDAAISAGIRTVESSLVTNIRNALWPTRERRRVDPKLLLRVLVGVDGVALCPHCGSHDTWMTKRQQIAKQNGGDTICNYRTCRSCEKRFVSIETLAQVDGKKTRRQNRINAALNTEKKCTKCDLTKPMQCFPRKGNTVLVASWCRECRNRDRSDRHTQSQLDKYGLTQEQYQRLLMDQKGGCAICGKSTARHSHGVNRQPLVFDHCHATGEFRGLLCQRCNRAIGLFGDSADALEQAARYLRSKEVSNGLI